MIGGQGLALSNIRIYDEPAVFKSSIAQEYTRESRIRATHETVT